MVVTIALETPGSKPATPASGTIATIESAGDLPDGTRALVIRGTGRAHVGSGETGARGALHVRVEPIEEHRGARRLGNIADLEDVPENGRELLHVHPVNDVREVLELALT